MQDKIIIYFDRTVYHVLSQTVVKMYYYLYKVWKTKPFLPFHYCVALSVGPSCKIPLK